jgi:hypothetical protein
VPKLELVERALADLVLPARKLRKIEAAHVREVATAISSFGFCDPALIDEQDRVLNGVVRVEAAKLLGLTHIPCIRANHLNASERRLVRIALNRLGEKGSWDFDELKVELEELILDDLPIEITGFSMTEVDQIVIEEEPAAVEAGPLAPEPDAKPVAQFGDMFVIGEHRILCGDSTDPRGLEILMSGHEARLILTDQPYNVAIAGHVTSGRHREFLVASGSACGPRGRKTRAMRSCDSAATPLGRRLHSILCRRFFSFASRRCRWSSIGRMGITRCQTGRRFGLAD